MKMGTCEIGKGLQMMVRKISEKWSKVTVNAGVCCFFFVLLPEVLLEKALILPSDGLQPWDGTRRRQAPAYQALAALLRKDWWWGLPQQHLRQVRTCTLRSHLNRPAQPWRYLPLRPFHPLAWSMEIQERVGPVCTCM